MRQLHRYEVWYLGDDCVGFVHAKNKEDAIRKVMMVYREEIWPYFRLARGQD